MSTHYRTGGKPLPERFRREAGTQYRRPPPPLEPVGMVARWERWRRAERLNRTSYGHHNHEWGNCLLPSSCPACRVIVTEEVLSSDMSPWKWRQLT